MDLELENEPAVWRRYRELQRREDREHLIERYMPFATMLAAKAFGDRQIREIEFDDFRQYALIGLVESVDRYDPAHGASFRTYAAHRIRGSILDGIERYNEVQQQISARARLREERFRELLTAATSAEPDPFMRLVDFAVGTAIGYMLEGSAMYRGSEEGGEHNLYRRRELADLTRVLEGLVATLPEQERTVVRYHYLQQMRFDAIAELLGLSKGRISQIHHRALKRMREHYDQLKLLRTDY